MPEPYTLVLEFSRAKEAGDPFAMRMEPQAYNRRLADKTYKDAELSWDEPFVAAIEALRAPKLDPEIKQRLGNALRAFLEKTGWSREEAALADAVELEHRVIVTIRSGAAELYTLPWELLALGQTTRHVGELPSVLIRYEWTGTSTKAERPSPRPAGGRIFLAYSHAGGRVLANEHMEAIQDACDRIEHPFDVDSDVLGGASHRTLADALEKAKKEGKPISVLHILCHGGPIGSTFGLMLDPDDPGGPPGVDSDTLAGLLAQHADTVRLCVVIACDSGNTGRLGNQMGSVAQAIHRAGVAAVVASRYPFSVKGAGEFVRAFYDALLVGSVEEAFVAGRQRLVTAGSGLDWASVQLYAREDDGFDARPIVFGPYRGLLAFEKRHARFFFGRNGKDLQGKDREVDQLVAKLGALDDRDEPRFLVVAGDSGTGKSSMVLASAVPGLEGKGWRSRVMRPGSAPMAMLDAALKGAPPPSGDAPTRGLLVVDQFEEVFTSVTRPEDRTAFVERLWELSHERGGWGVIATVRIDFLGRFGEILLDKEKGLRLDRIACDPAHQVLVAQMDALQLRDAIEKPALAAGLSLEHGLTERILGDVDQEPGALPLMQHALRLMWEKREGRALTQAAYDALNRVIGALNMHADGVVDDLVRADAANQQTVRRLLLGLVNVGHGDAPNMRRRAMIAELRPDGDADAARFDAVLGMLVDQRLLVRSGTGREQTIEVAHEALIRRWETLGKWIKEERGKLLARDDLHGWAESCKQNGELLTRGQLEMAELLVNSNPELVKGEALSLVRESRVEIDRRVEQARRFRDTLRVTLAREYLGKDPVVSAVLLREVEATDPAKVRTWLECAMDVLRRPAMVTAVLEGHDDEVTSAAFSPDGTRVVTASYDRTARVWSAATGEPLLTLAGHTKAINAAGWSPDGTRVVTASEDGTTRVWSAATGEPLLELAAQQAAITAAAWSPDGTRIVTASADGAGCVWSAATGEPLASLKGHRARVNAARWSPDGTRIVTAAGEYGSPDRTARVWDAGTGKELLVFEGHAEEVNSTAWHADGEHIATGSNDRSVIVWEARTGAVSVRLEDVASPRSVAFSPDGTRMAIACIDSKAQVVDATTGEVLATLDGHRGWLDAAAWSFDGTRIVTASQDRTARVWNVVTGQALNTARVTRARSGAVRAELEAHAGVVLSVTVDPSGKTRQSDAGSTWAALTGEVLVVLDGRGWRAAWSPDGTRVVTCAGEGDALLRGVRVWDAETGESLATFQGHTDFIDSVAWSPDGAELATGSRDRTARVWDAETGKARLVLEGHPEPVESAVWSVDRKKIVTVCKRSTWLWDAKTGAALGSVEAPEGTRNLAAWSPDGERAVLACEDSTARVWNMGTREAGTTLRGHTGGVSTAAWSPDGTRIATGSMDRTARVWNAATGELSATLRGHEEPINSVAWSADGTKIVTGSNDNTARVWDAKTGEPLSTHVGHGHYVYTAAFSPDGSRIVTASHDGTARVWSIDPEHLRDRLWRATPYCLPAARRTELLDEDAITAEKNAKAHREEEARRRDARPVLDVKVVTPDPEEQRHRWASAVAAAHASPPVSEAAPPAASTTAPQAAPAAAPGSDDLHLVLGELRALFLGAEQKVGDLLSRLAQRLPPLTHEMRRELPQASAGAVQTSAGAGRASAGALQTSAGAGRASAGALQTSAGAGRASAGALQTSAGAGRASAGALQTSAGAGRASAGALQTSAGAGRASAGALQTSAGAGRASAGALQTSAGAGRASAGAVQTSAGAGRASAGAVQTSAGAGRASAGALQTSTGAGRASAGAVQTSAGAGRASAGAVQTSSGAGRASA